MPPCDDKVLLETPSNVFTYYAPARHEPHHRRVMSQGIPCHAASMTDLALIRGNSGNIWKTDVVRPGILVVSHSVPVDVRVPLLLRVSSE